MPLKNANPDFEHLAGADVVVHDEHLEPSAGAAAVSAASHVHQYNFVPGRQARERRRCEHR